MIKDKVKDGEVCALGFTEQCRLVWEGIKKGYKYDGCTVVPDFNFGQDCCNAHDYHYIEQNITRAEADYKLRACILKKGMGLKDNGQDAYVALAYIYWVGVRVFGWFWWNRRKTHKAKQQQSEQL